MIRKALPTDIPAIAEIYHLILQKEAENGSQTGWQEGVYPTADTAREALQREELFVVEEDGAIVTAGRLNHDCEPEYSDCAWGFAASGEEIMVLHTLVVDPRAAGHGYGRRFVEFSENYAREQGCRCLRMDTNVTNLSARRLYASLGYREAGTISCEFNGTGKVLLVCLEKALI